MSTIRKLTLKDMDTFVTIVTNAYPGMKVVSEEEKKRVKQRLWKVQRIDPAVNMYGLFRRGKLVGGMRMFDFTMNMLSTYIPVGGLGLVAVDLAHKKEHVCKELVEYFTDHYRRKKFPMLALYPFRPDFYRKMGYGYGAKMNEYRIRPAELPRGNSKKHIVDVTQKDVKAIDDCYHRVVAKTHGMMKRTKSYSQMLFFRPERHIVAYKKGARIEGYMIFAFKSTRDDNWLTTEIRSGELIYENTSALMELLTYLHSQADQIDIIVLRTQDEFFHFVPHDPRTDSGRLIIPVGHETNNQGIGIMYRIIDTPGLFRALKNHDFNGWNCRLKITVRDSFCPTLDGSYIIHFVNGKSQVKARGDYDVEIALDVADYSSMVMGVVPFAKLCEYGLAEISNPRWLDTVTGIFAAPQKPHCVTQF